MFSFAAKASFEAPNGRIGLPQAAALSPETQTFPESSTAIPDPASWPDPPRNVFHWSAPPGPSFAANASIEPPNGRRGVPQAASLVPATWMFPEPSTAIALP